MDVAQVRRLPAHQRRSPGKSTAHRFQQDEIALFDAPVAHGNVERKRNGRRRRVAVHLDRGHNLLGRDAELVLGEITNCLERGETVKLSSFGSFVVRKKGQRIGRNPKTGKEVPISPRRVMVFKPSAILKQRINGADVPDEEE